MKSRFLLASTIAALIGIATACGGTKSPTSATSGTSATTPASSTSRATLQVVLKDTPFSDAKSVLVTFSEVSVHASGGGWETVPFASGTSRTCDLKQLQAATDILGTTALDAGHYTQVRLIVTDAVLYWDHAVSMAGPCVPTNTLPVVPPTERHSDLDIPSGQVILNRPFDLAASATVTMLLDFDGDKSINQTGNGKYKMQPVIAVVSVQ